MNRHLHNLTYNWGGHAATLVVMFFLSPYIVGKLDAISYGIWSLINVLTGYMGILDLGVRASVGRHVALYLGREDQQGIDETIRAGFGFFSLAGGLIFLGGVLIGWLFPNVFKGVSPEYYSTVRILLPMMVINVWLSSVAAIYSSVLAAYERFDIARGIDIVVLIVRTAGTIWVLEMGWGLWGMVYAVILGNICAVIGNRVFSGKIHGIIRSFPLIFSKKRFGELFGYGLPAFVISSATKIAGQSDLVIVGIFLTVSDVRDYSVGAMIIFYSSTFVRLISRTMFPSIQKALSSENMKEAYSLFELQIKIALVFGLLTFWGYAFYSNSFIKLWMFQESFGLDSVNASSMVMSILAISNITFLFTYSCETLLAASGKVSKLSLVVCVESLINVIISIIFVRYFKLGLAGVALGTLCSRFFVGFLFIIRLFLKEVNKKTSYFFFSIILPALIASIVFVSYLYVTLHYFQILSWGHFAVHVFVAILIWFIISFFILFPAKQKRICIREIGF